MTKDTKQNKAFKGQRTLGQSNTGTEWTIKLEVIVIVAHIEQKPFFWLNKHQNYSTKIQRI